MTSLIHPGAGTGQGQENGQEAELAMGSEPFPRNNHSVPDGLEANRSPVSAALPTSVPVVEKVYRHRLPVRISHWLNVPFLIILIMSGLQIFNAHPALYWGDRSDRDQPLISIRPEKTESGEMRGITTILGHKFDTTGVLGYSDGKRRAFPAWATIPSAKVLAMGRQWHLFFAWALVINGLFFMTYALISRHVARDLAPTGTDLRGIGKAVKDHIVLRHPTGDEAKRYNVLQKLAYVVILYRPDGPRDVADDRYGVPLAAHDLRWTAGRADDPFHCLFFFRRFYRHSHVASHSDRVPQQHAVHDHWMVCGEA